MSQFAEFGRLKKLFLKNSQLVVDDDNFSIQELSLVNVRLQETLNFNRLVYLRVLHLQGVCGDAELII